MGCRHLEPPGVLCQSCLLPKMNEANVMLPYSGKEEPAPINKQGLRYGAASSDWGDPVLSMQLSVLQVGVTLMLFPVLNWRLCPLSSGDPCGLGLDWKELLGWPLPPAWHLFPHWSREGRQHKERPGPTGQLGKGQGVVSGCLHLKPVRPEPTPWGRKSLCRHHQPSPKPPAVFLSLPCPVVSSASSLVPPIREDAKRGWGKEYLQAA